MSKEYRVEPRGSTHNRDVFESGVPALDRYLREQAGQDGRRNIASPFVLLDSAGAIAGYYTLSAYTVKFDELPEALARRFPHYQQLPVTMLGRPAISQAHQGLGLGRLLLADALDRSWRSNSTIASMCVLVEAIDESARSFYVHYGFEQLTDQPNRLFLPMTTIGKAAKAR